MCYISFERKFNADYQFRRKGGSKVNRKEENSPFGKEILKIQGHKFTKLLRYNNPYIKLKPFQSVPVLFDGFLQAGPFPHLQN